MVSVGQADAVPEGGLGPVATGPRPPSGTASACPTDTIGISSIARSSRSGPAQNSPQVYRKAKPPGNTSRAAGRRRPV